MLSLRQNRNEIIIAILLVLDTARPWATQPQEALILKIHGSKFCQKLHWLSFFGTKPQRYTVLEFFHITSRYTVFWATLIAFGPKSAYLKALLYLVYITSRQFWLSFNINFWKLFGNTETNSCLEHDVLRFDFLKRKTFFSTKYVFWTTYVLCSYM